MAPFIKSSPLSERHKASLQPSPQVNASEEPDPVFELVQEFKKRGHYEEMRKSVMQDFLKSVGCLQLSKKELNSKNARTQFDSTVRDTTQKFLSGANISSTVVPETLQKQREIRILEQLTIRRVFSNLYSDAEVRCGAQYGTFIQSTLEAIMDEKEKGTKSIPDEQARLDALRAKRRAAVSTQAVKSSEKTDVRMNQDFARQLIDMASQAPKPKETLLRRIVQTQAPTPPTRPASTPPTETASPKSEEEGIGGDSVKGDTTMDVDESVAEDEQERPVIEERTFSGSDLSDLSAESASDEEANSELNQAGTRRLRSRVGQ